MGSVMHPHTHTGPYSFCAIERYIGLLKEISCILHLMEREDWEQGWLAVTLKSVFAVCREGPQRHRFLSLAQTYSTQALKTHVQNEESLFVNRGSLLISRF